MILIGNRVIVQAGQSNVLVTDLDDKIIVFPACRIVIFSTVNVRDPGMSDGSTAIGTLHFIFKRYFTVNTMALLFEIYSEFFCDLIGVLRGNPDGNIVIFYVVRKGRSLRLCRCQAEGQDEQRTTQEELFYRFHSKFTFTFSRCSLLSISYIGLVSKWKIPAIILHGIVCTDVL